MKEGGIVADISEVGMRRIKAILEAAVAKEKKEIEIKTRMARYQNSKFLKKSKDEERRFLIKNRNFI